MIRQEAGFGKKQRSGLLCLWTDGLKIENLLEKNLLLLLLLDGEATMEI